jgi:hypothetical protein
MVISHQLILMTKSLKRISLFVALSLLLYSVAYAFVYQTETQSVTQTINKAWYNSNWQYRKQITINYTKVSANLTDFPILISQSNDADIASHARNDGWDIVFTSSDRKTKLNHELETYNSTTGGLVAWVRVPTVSNISNTILYMYYGNPTSSDQQNSTGTWSGFQGVWHLKENPAGTAPQMKDSTSNAHDGTTTGMVSGDQMGGKIDGSLNFDATDAYVQTTSGDSQISTSFTWETWFKADSTTGAHLLLWEGPVAENGWGGGAAGHQEAQIHVGAYNVDNIVGAFYGTDELANPVYINVAFTDTTAFHHVAFVLTNAGSSPSGELFLDGVSVGTDTGNQTSRTEWNTNLRIGRPGVSTRYFDGIADEVRVSNISRSAEWIATEYNNQNSPSTFYSVASEETK